MKVNADFLCWKLHKKYKYVQSSHIQEFYSLQVNRTIYVNLHQGDFVYCLNIIFIIHGSL